MRADVRRVVAGGVLLLGFGWGVLGAQTTAPQTTAPETSPVRDPAAVTLHGSQSDTPHTWTTDQLLTSTVHEAWVLSGRNEDQFFDMVKELAAMSAQKRGLTLPETADAGAKAGQMIKREARKDPDQLLYAVVDRAVMKTGTKTPGTAATQ